MHSDIFPHRTIRKSILHRGNVFPPRSRFGLKLLQSCPACAVFLLRPTHFEVAATFLNSPQISSKRAGLERKKSSPRSHTKMVSCGEIDSPTTPRAPENNPNLLHVQQQTHLRDKHLQHCCCCLRNTKNSRETTPRFFCSARHKCSRSKRQQHWTHNPSSQVTTPLRFSCPSVCVCLHHAGAAFFFFVWFAFETHFFPHIGK